LTGKPVKINAHFSGIPRPVRDDKFLRQPLCTEDYQNVAATPLRMWCVFHHRALTHTKILALRAFSLYATSNSTETLHGYLNETQGFSGDPYFRTPKIKKQFTEMNL
jgi:hypothetical protein